LKKVCVRTTEDKWHFDDITVAERILHESILCCTQARNVYRTENTFGEKPLHIFSDQVYLQF